MLCSICTDFVDRRVELVKLNVERHTDWGTYMEPLRHQHYTTTAALQASSALCYICATLWNSLSIEEQDLLTETRDITNPVSSIILGETAEILDIAVCFTDSVRLLSRLVEARFVIDEYQGKLRSSELVRYWNLDKANWTLVINENVTLSTSTSLADLWKGLSLA